MRLLGLILVMAVGATFAVYTPLKNIYPPRHEVVAFAARMVPEIANYIPASLMVPPEGSLVHPEVTVLAKEAYTLEVQDINLSTIADDRMDDAPVEEDGTMWLGFQADQLGTLLNEMGYPAEQTIGDDGEQTILVNRAEGLDFGLILKSCDESDIQDACGAVQIAAIVFQDIDDGVVASMNRRHDAMKFSKMDGGDLQITRYLTAKYGIARGNVEANIDDFVDILDLYMGTG